MRLRPLALALVFVLAGCASSTDAGAATASPARPGLSDCKLRLQPLRASSTSVPAFKVPLASPPRSSRPVSPHVAAIAFDADGRLWAATAGYSDDGSDAVYVVDAPGATPKAILTNLHTPLGLVWDGGVLYVASAGRIDAYSGLSNGAFATRRTVVTFEAGVGEVNGLALAPDGRLVVGVSAACDACTPASKQAAAVLTMRTDGTDLTVLASGIRAPVGLAYVPGTDDLLVTMNQRDDLGDATPGDWLALVRAGQAWGFPDCYGQGGEACQGVPAPVAVLDKHAAVSGVAVVSDHFGPLARNIGVRGRMGDRIGRAGRPHGVGRRVGIDGDAPAIPGGHRAPGGRGCRTVMAGSSSVIGSRERSTGSHRREALGLGATGAPQRESIRSLGGVTSLIGGVGGPRRPARRSRAIRSGPATNGAIYATSRIGIRNRVTPGRTTTAIPKSHTNSV